MSTSPLPRGSIRVTTGNRNLPVEVRDQRMRLVDQGVSGWSPRDRANGREFRLDPGSYVVSVRLPGGRSLAAAVEVHADDDYSVDLTPEDQWLIPRARYTTAAFPAASPPPAAQVGQPSDWAVRFFRMEGLSNAVPDTAVRMAQMDESAPGPFTFEIGVYPPGVIFAQLAHSTQTPLNVALLASPEAGCFLTLEEDAGTIFAGVLPAGYLVERAAQFLAAGEDEHAALLVSGEEAESLLYGKVSDPIGAAIGGYVLLRLNELERTHDWTQNLASWFQWLPDGAVIAGERAAMAGDHLLALNYFLQVGGRGLPLFTDGFSILVSRLRQYETNSHIRTRLTDQQAYDVHALSSRLEEWSSFVDFSALTLTFRAAVPNEPAESQFPIEVGEDFIRWHR
jgi:hypothetical protein